MAKGFFKGAIWGVGVSICAVALISIADGRSGTVRSDASGTGPAQQTPTSDLGGGDGPSAVGLVTPDVPAPEPDTLAGLLSDTLSPAAVPQAGSASALKGAETPDSEALAGIATPSTEGPQVNYSETGALKTPATEPGVSVSTEPAQPVAPEPVPQATAFAEPKQPEVPETVAPQNGGAGVEEPQGTAAQNQNIESELPSVALDPEQPELPSIETETSGFGQQALTGVEVPTEVAPQNQQIDNTSQPQVATPLPAPVEKGPASVDAEAPEQPTAQQVTAGVVRPAEPENGAPETSAVLDLPVPETPAQETEEGESSSTQVEAELSVNAPIAGGSQEESAVVAQISDVAPDPQITEALPVLSVEDLTVAPDSVVPDEKPVKAPLTEPAPEQPDANEQSAAVRVNRLPTLGAITPEETPGVEEVVALPEIESPLDQAPIDRFAAEFENDEDKPLMAVILMDDGVDLSASATGLTAVQQLPYPVSFAVDALLPDAAARMRAYRAAGFEVLAMVDLPEGAQAPDAEVNLSFALEALPEVVGVLDGVRTGVQTTPEAGRQVAQILAQSGHGFVTQNRGLNTVQKLASRQGVPSAVVFRDFDSKGQPSAVIRRFLDQAAFRAGQEGAVVMLGRLREETLAALVVWTLQDRASSVAMAPISDTLLRGQ